MSKKTKSPHLLSRRDVLGLLGAAGLTSLSGCGKGADTAQGSGSTSATGGGTGTTGTSSTSGSSGSSGSTGGGGGTFARPKIAVLDYWLNGGKFGQELVNLHARYDYSIVGMQPSQANGGAGLAFVQALKSANPAIQIGQYTILSQMYNIIPGALAELTQSIRSGGTDGKDWWARAAASSPVDPGGMTKSSEVTGYDAWEVNQTRFVKPTADGKRWPEKCAEGYHHLTLGPLYEGHALDFVFSDNTWWKPGIGTDGASPTAHLLGGNLCADYMLTGQNNDPNDPTLQVAWRQGYVNYWARLRQLMPNIAICPNADCDRTSYDSCLTTPELKNQVEYAFIEALSSKDYSVATFSTMDNVMKRYRSQLHAVSKTVFVGAYVNTGRDTLGRTLQKARFGLALALLDDGVACVSDQATGRTPAFWFDELEAPLGKPLAAGPAGPWKSGIWRRDYQGGCVLLNPQENNGRFMPSCYGTMTLTRSGSTVTLSWDRMPAYDKVANRDKIRIQDCADPTFNGTFTLTDVQPTYLRWTQTGQPAATLTKPHGFFELQTTVSIEPGFKHILGTQDSHDDYDNGTTPNDGKPVTSVTLWSNDAVILLRG